MLLVQRDAAGHLLGAINYEPVNATGGVDRTITNGWLWIEQLELSAGVDSRTVIRQFIQDIATLNPEVQGAYWVRRDSTGDRPHWFTRSRLVQHSEEVRV